MVRWSDGQMVRFELRFNNSRRFDCRRPNDADDPFLASWYVISPASAVLWSSKGIDRHCLRLHGWWFEFSVNDLIRNAHWTWSHCQVQVKRWREWATDYGKIIYNRLIAKGSKLVWLGMGVLSTIIRKYHSKYFSNHYIFQFPSN